MAIKPRPTDPDMQHPKQSDERGFFLLWGDDDEGPPTGTYRTLDDARGAARRKAVAHPGVRYYVLHAVEYVRFPQGVTHERLAPPFEPLPF